MDVLHVEGMEAGFFQDMLVLGGVRHGFTNPAQAWSNVFDV